MSYIASAQTVPAALSGEVDVSLGGGYAAMVSRLGGSDLSIFFNVTNWSPYELMVTPDITSGADLQGGRQPAGIRVGRRHAYGPAEAEPRPRA